MALFGRAASTGQQPLHTPSPLAPDLTILCSKVTNPQAETENPNDIREFCDAVNQAINGPQQVVTIVVPKIQSLNEREAIYTLNLVEACVKSCGPSFHAEIGKFRFLNEIIKLLSPKYLGNTTPERVKKRAIELLYSWSKGLPSEPKIKEAYEMLKQQGLITVDPIHIDCHYDNIKSNPTAAPKERVKNPIFDDEDKNKTRYVDFLLILLSNRLHPKTWFCSPPSTYAMLYAMPSCLTYDKLLTKLLQSKNKEDLEAANRLIKTMVKEDEEKIQKQYKRTEELDTIHNNMRLMTDMLNNYCKTSSQADIDLIKELKESLEKFRPRIFHIAAETDENDESIGDVLLASDDLASLLERYNITVGNPHYIPPDAPAANDKSASNNNENGLVDLNLLSSSPNLIVDELSQLGIFDPSPATNSTQAAPELSTQDNNPFSGLDSLVLGNSSTFSSSNVGGLDTNPFSVPLNATSINSASQANATMSHKTATPPVGVSPQHVAQINQMKPNMQVQQSQVADLSKNVSKRNSAQNGAGVAGASVGAFGELDSMAKNWLQNTNQVIANVKDPSQDSGIKCTSPDELSRSKSPDVPLINEMVAPLVDTSPTSTPKKTAAISSKTLSRSHREDFTFFNIKPSPKLKPLSILDDSELKLCVTVNFTSFTLPSSGLEEEMNSLTDIIVLTVSNTGGDSYCDVSLQVACPKGMKSVVGVASSTALPAQTPFAPPSVINQCLFIHNQAKVIPRLKLRLSMSRAEPDSNTAESKTITKLVDCSLDCLISECDLEFSDFT